MHAFYINLERRADRRQDIESELKKTSLVYERFPAVSRPDNPAIGCTLSHLEALKLARDRKYDSVLIFEDDFQFLVDPATFDFLLASLPDPYDVVMLDYYIIHSEPYNESFNRILEAQSAGGYIVHSRMYDRLIETYEEAVALFEANPHCHWLYINDQYWKRLQPVSHWYSTRIQMGRQRPGYSDLKHRILENVY